MLGLTYALCMNTYTNNMELEKNGIYFHDDIAGYL